MTFQPLSGMDAGFLYMETPTLHMHTLKVAVFSPAEEHSPISFEGFCRVLGSKLAKLPSFRQRLMEIPFGLNHPLWVDDENFDLSRHLDHRTASAPGSQHDLNAIVSEIASKPLPRDRPLWQITMVDGLEGGRVAFVCKLHHSMADGAAVMAMLLEVLSPTKSGDGPADQPAPQPPGKWEIARWSIGQVFRTLGSLPRLMWQTLLGLFGLARRASTGSHPSLPAPFSGPKTNWNGALTPRRSFATTRIPLADMKLVKRSLGVTLNDVVLAICGSVLRAHLEEVEGAVPEKPLVASVPINTHPELTTRTRGNHVGHLTASLFTQIADPIERILAIHEMTDEGKQRQMTVGPDLLERWIEFSPPKAHAAVVRFWSKHRVADFVPPPMNLVVSNVPGPRTELIISGHALEALYSVGPILEGIGLNITGWSYGDQVYFVGLACPDQISDIQQLVDRLPGALAELVSACEAGHASESSQEPRQTKDSIREPVHMGAQGPSTHDGARTSGAD